MSTPANYVDWYHGLPIKWFAAEEVGQYEGTANGTLIDTQLARVKAGIKARMPGQAPTDALPHIGGDRGLVQGPIGSNADFIIRLQTAWDNWARAGTFLEMLVQLYWAGYTGVTIVQQNGLAFSLSGNPTAGVDPTSLLVITDCDATTSVITSSITPTRQIPAGTPWFWFDSNTDLCSRFAIIITGALPIQKTRVTFTNSDVGTATWLDGFTDTSYSVYIGGVTVTDGGEPVVVGADGSTKTIDGIDLDASAPFTGYVDMLAAPAGVDPFTYLSPIRQTILKSLISRWRPNAVCAGVFALFQGETWDFPLGKTWDGDSLTWDTPAEWAQLLGSF